MGFRFRLTAVLVATLAVLQLVTTLLVYQSARRELIEDGGRTLASHGRVFAAQLDDVSQRVADNVQVLALDFALREAIAGRDGDTVKSVLRNHGRRIGAARMMLVGLDGTVEADTARAEPLQVFPYPELLGRAIEHRSAEVVALGGRAYWMVVVPVLAPTPIALIAAGIPVDDALLARMQALSALPNAVQLVSRNPDAPDHAARALDGQRPWRVIAESPERVPIAAALSSVDAELPEVPTIVTAGGHEYVALAVPLNEGAGKPQVAAVLGTSLDAALRPYRSVATTWFVLSGAGLVAALIATLLVARGVSRPVEALAAVARRIESGDYTAPTPSGRNDEIGHLARAFGNMAQAIAVREERIRHAADHDVVTGLPNRLAFERAVSACMAHDARGALLTVRSTRADEIVKTTGHAIWDDVVRDLAERTRIRAGDRPLARVSDSELAMYVAGVDRREAIAAAFRLLDALAEPHQQKDLAIDIAPIVGIALSPVHGTDANALLQRAEVALFAAMGTDEPVAVYDPATDPHRPERLSLMGDLREAIERDALSLHFQPKLDLATRQVVAVEGLVRWTHPRRGPVPVSTFIELAEETGNIRRLTRWVLAAGISQLQAWHARGVGLRMALNLSARDLADEKLPRRVAELLALHGMPADRVTLEITESAMMVEPDRALHVLKRLADLGTPLSIDDFGVGRSSFAYLRRLPVRELKLDKSFVLKLGDDRGDRTIVESMVALGHRLGFSITAEGVEDAGALEFLASIGCDHAQGFHIARPMTPESLEAWLLRDQAIAPRDGELPGRATS